jgi:high-affinity Fe2+/Pb2+ permease
MENFELHIGKIKFLLVEYVNEINFEKFLFLFGNTTVFVVVKLVQTVLGLR